MIDESTIDESLEGEEKFIDLDCNVKVCMLETDNYSFHVDDFHLMEYITKQVELKLTLDLVLLVELNLVESLTQQ